MARTWVEWTRSRNRLISEKCLGELGNHRRQFQQSRLSWGCVSAIDSQGRTTWIVNAHRDDGKRFVVHADEKLSAFVELESAICACGELPRRGGRVFRNSPDMKRNIPLLLIIFSIVCFGLLQKAQAVLPPPDGGYPNFNTAEGTKALFSLTTGSANTAVGWYSLFSDTEGSFNTATGAGTLLFNTADANTAFGAAALLFNATGANNTAVGAAALLNNIAGDNTAVGSRALSNNTTGGSNTAMGSFALFANTMGFSNTAIGVSALGNTSGFGNTALGVGAGGALTTANNVICIGRNVFGANVDNSCFIGNIWNQPGGSQAVYVNADGKLGAQVSSRRFKEEIKPINEGSEALFSLKPVTFRYKKEIDPARTSQFGLVAEDVEKVNPDLVVRDKESKPYSVRYDQVNAMLLNEFLKEHRKVEQLTKDFESKLAEQQKQIEARTAGLQKVSAQIEASKPAPQVVNNP
jgi:hypothetical protein